MTYVSHCASIIERRVFLLSFCTQLYVVQTADSVLLFRMSAIERISCMSTHHSGWYCVHTCYIYVHCFLGDKVQRKTLVIDHIFIAWARGSMYILDIRTYVHIPLPVILPLNMVCWLVIWYLLFGCIEIYNSDSHFLSLIVHTCLKRSG